MVKTAYIGTVESRDKANYLCEKYKNVVISGVDHKGNYELSVETESNRLVGMMQSALARGKM